MHFYLFRQKLESLAVIVFIAFSFMDCFSSSDPIPNKEVDLLGGFFVVKSGSDSIQKAIDALPENGGTIFVKANTYILKKGIRIQRSDVKILGEKGVKIKLADHANQPVIAIGSDEEIPRFRIRNISISDLEIDGNKENQESELSPGKLWIRCNGIDVRMVDNLWIQDVNISNTISGGLVVSWDSHRIFIRSSMFHNNTYDGIAFYASEDILVSNFASYENGAGGISMDNGMKTATFSNGLVKNNKDVGIFAREAKDICFFNLMISGSGNNGCFLSHKKGEDGTGVSRCFFSGCYFLDNKGWGLWLAATKDISPGNVAVSSLFSGNMLGAIRVDEGGSLEQSGNISQERGYFLK